MPSAADAIARALERTGVEYPRGALGPAVRTLANAIGGEPGAVLDAADELSAVHWPELGAAIGATLRHARQRADSQLQEDLDVALAHADDPNPTNPLARMLALRAGRDLAASLERVRSYLDLVDLDDANDVDRRAADVAIELADLSSDLFEPEIADFVAAGEGAAALRVLARETGDPDVRAWVRDVLGDLGEPSTAARAIRSVGAGPIPDDPADDRLWVAVVAQLALDAVDLASVMYAGDGDEPA